MLPRQNKDLAVSCTEAEVFSDISHLAVRIFSIIPEGHPISVKSTPLVDGEDGQSAIVVTATTARPADPKTPPAKPIPRYFHVLRDGIALPPKQPVLSPKEEAPIHQSKREHWPDHTEQPDVDLFISDAEPSSDFIECDDAPVEDGVYPDNAAVCQKFCPADLLGPLFELALILGPNAFMLGW